MNNISLILTDNPKKHIYDLLDQYLKKINTQNIVLVGNKDDKEYSNLKTSFWDEKNIFPYVEENNEYAYVSPFVCSYFLTLVNKPTIFLFFNYVEQNTNTICKNICFFIFTNKQLKEQQKDILEKNNISYKKENTTKDMDTNEKKEIKKEDNQNKINYNYNIEEKTICILKPIITKTRLEFHLTSVILNKTSGSLSFYMKRKYPAEFWKLFYNEKGNESWFEEMCAYLSTTSVTILIIEGVNIITKIRKLIGPTDPAECNYRHLRYVYGRDIKDNALHSSESNEDYLRERKLIFGFGKNKD